MDSKIWYQIFHTEEVWSSLILRITLGGVVLPHVLQKLFGWFNGPGLAGEMIFMKSQVGLPTFVAVIAIITECLGVFMILSGFGTRIAALAFFFLFVGMILHVHLANGFFMNWFGKLPSGQEGFEYHLLVLGICLVLFFEGGGKWALDSLIR
ncbi:DoxX family protein [Pedobacter heparinus]|uniref:DoxX family protein n=1 Tax=Pedobacter heparinus TaxID=984 RepID=UPI002930C2B5|nr:DoxX family protein [Pedobacter heparinus]